MPSDDFSASVFLPTDADTTTFGASLAKLLQPGDVVLLQGPIGAGKTHLARAIILARLAHAEDVPSPTYTLVQTYQADDVEIWHADLYRLGDASEIEELGLIDAFDTAISLIEWPDRLGLLAPDDALKITFAHEGNGRRLTLTSPSDSWTRLEGIVAHA